MWVLLCNCICACKSLSHNYQHLSTYNIINSISFINLNYQKQLPIYQPNIQSPKECWWWRGSNSRPPEIIQVYNPTGQWFSLLFDLFGLMVEYSVLWFSIYLVLWIRSMDPARYRWEWVKHGLNPTNQIYQFWKKFLESQKL